MLGRRARISGQRIAAGQPDDVGTIDELMPKVAQNETRADVARRLDSFGADRTDFDDSDTDDSAVAVVFVNDEVLVEVYPGRTDESRRRHRSTSSQSSRSVRRP